MEREAVSPVSSQLLKKEKIVVLVRTDRVVGYQERGIVRKTRKIERYRTVWGIGTTVCGSQQREPAGDCDFLLKPFLETSIHCGHCKKGVLGSTG